MVEPVSAILWGDGRRHTSGDHDPGGRLQRGWYGGVAGTLWDHFIPSPNNVVSEWAIDPDFRCSSVAGDSLLHLTHEGQDGTDVIAVAQRGRNGIFYVSETGIPVARIPLETLKHIIMSRHTCSEFCRG